MRLILLHQNSIGDKALLMFLERKGVHVNPCTAESFNSSLDQSSPLLFLVNTDHISGLSENTRSALNDHTNNLLLIGPLSHMHWLLKFPHSEPGYLCRKASTDLLIDGIAKMTRHMRFFSPRVLKLFESSNRKRQELLLRTKLIKALSKTELLIMGEIATGQSATQIAARLYRSPHTVYNHRKNIRNKIALSPRLNLTKFCILHKDAIFTLREADKVSRVIHKKPPHR